MFGPPSSRAAGVYLAALHASRTRGSAKAATIVSAVV